MLDARRLRLLRELSLHGTVAATAEALHLTGPAVSQQLAALEREAGVPLLEKQGRVLRLTAAGSLLVEHAEVILGGIAAAEADLLALRGGGRVSVRVAAFPSAARVLMPDVWRRVTQGADGGDGVDLRIVEREPGLATDALRRREVDIAVVHAYSLLPREVPAGCESRWLMDDPVELAVNAAAAKAWGWRAGSVVELRQVSGENWLMPGRETSCHELTRRACGAAGYVPQAIAEAGDFATLIALVAAGAGVALVPRMTLPSDMRGVSLHPLTQPIVRTVSVVTRAGEERQPGIRRVIEALAQAADTDS